MLKRNNFGFTILEALIAISVLTLGIVFVIYIFPVALNLEENNKIKTQSIFLASEKMEELFSKSYKDVSIGTTTESSLDFPFEKFSRQTRITFIDKNFSEISQDKGLKKIEITVFYNTPFKMRKITEIKSLITDR
ncbi:MAG: type IV pilus modification PilV family protein [Minisyncoccia bacterium]